MKGIRLVHNPEKGWAEFQAEEQARELAIDKGIEYEAAGRLWS